MSGPEVNWEEMIAKCEDMGLLAKRLFVVFTTPTNGLGPVMEKLEEHLKFQGELEAKGIMFGAGPFPNDDEVNWGGEGMVIIRADSKADAEKIAASDPMHASGARSFKVRPWLLNEGKVTVELTYSNKAHKVI